MTRTNTIAIMLATLIPFSSGCAVDLEEEAAAAVVSSSLETARKQSAARQVAEAVDENCSLSAEQVAQGAAKVPAAGLYPASCVTKTAQGSSVHAEYDHCTGPFGYGDLSGGLDARITVTGQCMLRAEIADSGDLSNHGNRFSYAATADVKVLPGERDVTWSASWSGTTLGGQSIEQSSNLSTLIDVASSCRDIDGTADGKIGGSPYTLDIEGLSICPDACPSKGTVMAQWDNARSGREMKVEFDGSKVAKVTGWSGRVFEVEMLCAPAK